MNIYKSFLPSDVAYTEQQIHEAIPLTGSLLSGALGTSTYNELNIKNYYHGMFQSVFDYPYLSSSATQICDISFGYSARSDYSSSANVDNEKKIRVYTQFALALNGTDTTGSVMDFDRDGELAGGTKILNAYFISFPRVLAKDEIQKGGFRLSMYTGAANITAQTPAGLVTFGDYGAASAYKTNSPVGEYAILYTSSGVPNSESGVGLIYYQAGLAVLTASATLFTNSFPGLGRRFLPNPTLANASLVSASIQGFMTGGTIENMCNAFRYRTDNIFFNNTTKLNSTIYFCRANHNEFNYSSNPTYTTGSKIVTKNKSKDVPTAYITGVGFYSADNELLAYGKLSEPLKKTSENEIVLRGRIDY